MFDFLNCGVDQINIPAILVANGVGASLMVIVMLGGRRRVKLLSRDRRFFYWMCQTCFFLCLLETAGFFLDGVLFPGARRLALLCNTVILLLAVAISFMWVCYMDCKLFANERYISISYPKLAIPAGIICLMSLANLFVDVFFGVDSGNNYYRTPLFVLPWLVVYSYMAYGALLSYRYQKHTDKYLFVPAVAFLVPVYLGSLIQLCCYGIALIWVSVALGLTFLYISLQHEEAYLDPLTGLYNRSYLLHYIDSIAVKRERADLHLTGIMLDINDFKRINDTSGHAEGDRVLCAVGEILHRCTQDGAVVIRYGGDEFIILLEGAVPRRAEDIRRRIHEQLRAYNDSGASRYPISLSVGTAEFDREDILGFFREMDQRMYREKRLFYLGGEGDVPAGDGK